jgi:DNA polymerase
MSMTREDVLRELELLPVWQLRAPLKVSEPITEKAQIVEAAIEAVTVNTSLEFITSDDKKWFFACPADRMDIGLQGMLFKNILHALKINKINKATLESITEASVIVAMGEIAAQQLLNSAESIEQLRSKTHIYQNIPLIVTYHPQDMLQHLPNKAKTWDDLCMALQLINA